MFKAKITADGLRNAAVQISGLVPQDKKVFKLVQFGHLDLKLTSVAFLIQEKAGLLLWWDEGQTDLLLPLESRGAFRFDTGLKSDKPWDGQIWATSFFNSDLKNSYYFLLLLDFDK